MKKSRTGRATAYDENAGRRRNAMGIIRAFGKGTVTQSMPFRLGIE
jgi:hypothetical protein